MTYLYDEIKVELKRVVLYVLNRLDPNETMETLDQREAPSLCIDLAKQVRGINTGVLFDSEYWVSPDFKGLLHQVPNIRNRAAHPSDRSSELNLLDVLALRTLLEELLRLYEALGGGGTEYRSLTRRIEKSVDSHLLIVCGERKLRFKEQNTSSSAASIANSDIQDPALSNDSSETESDAKSDPYFYDWTD